MTADVAGGLCPRVARNGKGAPTSKYHLRKQEVRLLRRTHSYLYGVDSGTGRNDTLSVLVQHSGPPVFTGEENVFPSEW